MKKQIPTILTVFCLALMVAVLFQNASLKKQIQRLENNLSNRIGNVESSVNGITYQIETKLEEGVALLSHGAWSFGEADMERGTVTVIFEVIPKEYEEEKTKAAIICNGDRYPMEFQDGMFRTTTEVSLFENTIAESVQFETDGQIQTETLNWGISPRYDYLPVVYAHFAGGTTGSPRNGVYTLIFDGELEVQIDQKGDQLPVQSVTLVEVVDGEEIGRIKLAETMDVNGTFSYKFDQKTVSFSYAKPEGTTYGLYVEVEDGYGLIHRAWAWRDKIGESGEPVDDNHWWWRGAEGSIFSAEGEPLAVHDGEFFQ